ncbi:MAG: hypothetical protein P8O20_02805 [Bacteroidia bacterium]|nr:hypothetical protein [Bacteroidia bacterium]
MNKKISVVIAFIGILIFAGFACKQSDPPKKELVNVDRSARVGDSIRFAGKDWKVKIYEDKQWGPGPNWFSGHEDDITVDVNGYLHMKIVNRDNKWMSTEVISDEVMGYGTYIFTLEADLESIPENIVLGLFTWDNNSFQEAANSEVDIEFSRWGDLSDLRTLQYGVQPINFGTVFPERAFRPEYGLGKLRGVHTHAFTWTDTLISWVSYAGDTYGSGEVLGTWKFDLNNPARIKEEGGNESDPIIIPKPGPETNARINFWILPWVNQRPTDGNEQEVIVRNFEYRPL